MSVKIQAGSLLKSKMVFWYKCAWHIHWKELLSITYVLCYCSVLYMVHAVESTLNFIPVCQCWCRLMWVDRILLCAAACKLSVVLWAISLFRWGVIFHDNAIVVHACGRLQSFHLVHDYQWTNFILSPQQPLYICQSIAPGNVKKRITSLMLCEIRIISQWKCNIFLQETPLCWKRSDTVQCRILHHIIISS